MCVCLCLEMAPESGSIQTAGERDWTGIVLQNPIKSIDFISKVKPFENLKADQDRLTYIIVIIWDCVGCIYSVDAIATLGKSSKMCFVFGQLDKIS